MTFRASVVLFNTPPEELENVIISLLKCEFLEAIDIIDNSSAPLEESCFLVEDKVNYIFNGENLGYGRAHNIAISSTCESKSTHHLVINADVDFNPSDIDHLYEVMATNSNVGLLMPKVIYPNGQKQPLCKRCPSPIDMLARLLFPSSFAPKWVREFDMRDYEFQSPTFIPYLSGCFMFLSTEVLSEVGMFDERFFLYPEDVDLSRRIAFRYDAVFYPDVTIAHRHDAASKKSFSLLITQMVEFIKYFNKWGWVFDGKRKYLNKRCGEEVYLQN
jgi:GT2 family glycosyltransferase